MFELLCNYIGSIFGLIGPIDHHLQALEIGQKIAMSRLPNIDYSKYTVKVHNVQSEWIVFYVLNDADGQHFMGGGGPEIHIRKSDGRITKYNLQR